MFDLILDADFHIPPSSQKSLHLHDYLYKVQSHSKLYQYRKLIHSFQSKYKKRSNHSLKVWTNQRESQLEFKISNSACGSNLIWGSFESIYPKLLLLIWRSSLCVSYLFTFFLYVVFTYIILQFQTVTIKVAISVRL